MPKNKKRIKTYVKSGMMLIIVYFLLFSHPGTLLAADQQAAVVKPTPHSMDFFGYIEGAMKGDDLAVYDSQGTLAGLFIIERDGQYGFLHVYGDDRTTDVDEGADKNEALTFELNGVPLAPLSGQPIHWLGDGKKQRVDF